jgi:hypothetical protein
MPWPESDAFMLRTGVPRFKQKCAPRSAVLTLIGACSAIVVGCYWSRYTDVMSLHLELLEQYAAKLAGLAQDHATVPVQSWGEFVYPLERARDFARIAAKRYPDRRSLVLFEQVLTRYGELTSSPEVLARADATQTIDAQVDRLEEAIAATRRELAVESGAETPRTAAFSLSWAA